MLQGHSSRLVEDAIVSFAVDDWSVTGIESAIAKVQQWLPE
jgi:hypothetical protein